MNNSSPKISVMMTVYNAEKFIREAIESILNQTFSDFEFIIIDDGSNDKSIEIIDKYSKEDKRILVFKNKKNLGLSKTRTKCVKYAKGKYIAIADADDISMFNRFEKQHNFLEGHEECGVVGGFIELFDSVTGKVIGIRKYYEDDARLRRKLFLYSPVAEPASMIRKDVFNKIGYYNPMYVTGDLDFWFRLGKEYKFANLQEILIKYRVHAKSITISKIRAMEAMTLKVRKEYSHGHGYSMSLLDKIFYLCLRISKYFMTYRIKVWLFNLLRNR